MGPRDGTPKPKKVFQTFKKIRNEKCKNGILINPNQKKKTRTKHSEREGREY